MISLGMVIVELDGDFVYFAFQAVLDALRLTEWWKDPYNSIDDR